MSARFIPSRVYAVAAELLREVSLLRPFRSTALGDRLYAHTPLAVCLDSALHRLDRFGSITRSLFRDVHGQLRLRLPRARGDQRRRRSLRPRNHDETRLPV